MFLNNSSRNFGEVELLTTSIEPTATVKSGLIVCIDFRKMPPVFGAVESDHSLFLIWPFASSATTPQDGNNQKIVKIWTPFLLLVSELYILSLLSIQIYTRDGTGHRSCWPVNTASFRQYGVFDDMSDVGSSFESLLHQLRTQGPRLKGGCLGGVRSSQTSA